MSRCARASDMLGGAVITLRVIKSLICISGASFACALRRLFCFKRRGLCLLFPLLNSRDTAICVPGGGARRCSLRSHTTYPRTDRASQDVTRCPPTASASHNSGYIRDRYSAKNRGAIFSRVLGGFVRHSQCDPTQRGSL